MKDILNTRIFNVPVPVIIVLAFMALVVVIVITESIKAFKKIKERKENALISITTEDRKRIEGYINNISNFDSARRKNKVLSCIIALVLIIGLLCLVYCMINSILPIPYFITVLILMGLLVLKNNPCIKYSKEYKEKVIKNIIHDFDPNLTYNPELGMNEQIYESSRFDSYDIYYSADLVTGKIAGLEFQMADIHTKDESTDSEGHTSTTTSFFGTFVYVVLNKNITDNIYITSTGREIFRGPKVLIDNESFNKKFSVCSEDSIMTLRILTPDVTNRILDLYNKTKIDMNISIQNNKVYFNLYTNGLFETSMQNKEEEVKNTYLYECMLRSIKEIIEEIIKVLDELEV